jgi:hypothetical protein
VTNSDSALEPVVGDLVRVPLYKSLCGNLMAASPEWIHKHAGKNTYRQEPPMAHNPPPRTQFVSALVVDSRRQNRHSRVTMILEILVGKEKIRIPSICVMEIIAKTAGGIVE